MATSSHLDTDFRREVPRDDGSPASDINLVASVAIWELASQARKQRERGKGGRRHRLYFSNFGFPDGTVSR